MKSKTREEIIPEKVPAFKVGDVVVFNSGKGGVHWMDVAEVVPAVDLHPEKLAVHWINRNGDSCWTTLPVACFQKVPAR